MRVIDKRERFNRRDFFRRTGGVAALATVATPLLSREALAQTLKTASPAGAQTLFKMARDLYPHDRLPDSFYEAAVATIEGGLADDPNKRSLLADGVRTLDAAAIKLKGRPYNSIANEPDRVAILKTLEGTAFFTTMRGGMVTALYNQKSVWPKFGYEGSSAEKGGYLHRGFNDIDWLPA
jgi:hypothetical protein